ncbi:MAG TPA: 2-C-methyl-D-erythritol 2,4-cyclodiphosphate synthase [Gaiellales bacterium]|nr:2-C-methyl-D-erythritol 2,4-cyclodiphosphate synthase [Gaiellales bacterium]
MGTAFDAHRLVPGRPLVLGGVEIPHSHGLEGHSDADIVCHALCDALLGAACMDDIGTLFPSSDERFRDARSVELLAEAWRRIAAAGWSLVNVDAFVVLQAPKLAPHRPAMRARVAEALLCEVGRVSVRATGTDGLGFTGRGEGAACQAVALLSAHT